MTAKRRPGRPTTIAGAEIISLRLPAELVARIDRIRGDVERSTWIRSVLEEHTSIGVEQALAEVVAFARRRGISEQRLAELLAG